MSRFAALLLVALLAGCGGRSQEPGPAPPQTARVYSSLPHSGPRADVHLAAVMAHERYGRGVEHVALDSTRPDMAGHDWEVGVVAANARRAAADRRAMAYVGEIASGASAVSLPILRSAGLAQVAPGGTWTGLARERPNTHFARVIPADHLHAVAVVSWMRALGTRRLVVVADGEGPGHDLAALVAADAAGAGIDTSEVTIDPKRLASIREVAEGVRKGRADTVYFGGIWQNRGVALWGRLHRAAPQVRLMGSDGIADGGFTGRILRSSRARTYITSTEAPPPRRFARAFRERFGHAPHPLAIYGHEAMRRALAAVAAGRGNRRAVINELFAAPGIDPAGDVERGRFGAYRIARDGSLRLQRMLLVGQ